MLIHRARPCSYPQAILHLEHYFRHACCAGLRGAESNSALPRVLASLRNRVQAFIFTFCFLQQESKTASWAHAYGFRNHVVVFIAGRCTCARAMASTSRLLSQSRLNFRGGWSYRCCSWASINCYIDSTPGHVNKI